MSKQIFFDSSGEKQYELSKHGFYCDLEYECLAVYEMDQFAEVIPYLQNEYCIYSIEDRVFLEFSVTPPRKNYFIMIIYQKKRN